MGTRMKFFAKNFLTLICCSFLSCQENTGTEPQIVFETDFSNPDQFTFSQELIDPEFDGTATAGIVNGEIRLASIQGSTTNKRAYAVASLTSPIPVPSATKAISVQVHWEIAMDDEIFTDAEMIINGKTIYLDKEAISLNAAQTTGYFVSPSATPTLDTMIFKLQESNDTQPGFATLKVKSVTVSQYRIEFFSSIVTEKLFAEVSRFTIR